MATHALTYDNVNAANPTKPTSKYETEFETVGLLGCGTFARTVQARHRLLHKDFAVKCIVLRASDGKTMENVLQEARTFATMNNRNIVRFYASWVEDEIPESIQALADVSSDHFSGPPSPMSAMSRRRASCLLWSCDDFATSFPDARTPSTTLSSTLLETSAPSPLTAPATSALTEPATGTTIVTGMTEPAMGGDEGDDYDRKKYSYGVMDDDDDDSQMENAPWTTLFIQMEMCEQTLYEKLRDETSDTALRLVWLSQLAAGVQYIHSLGLVHNDLKPQNIYLVGNEVRIGDFGLASTASAWNTNNAGTPMYAPPEHTRSPASDVYSMGLIIIEALTHSPNGKAEELAEMLSAAREGIIPCSVGGIADFLRRMLSADPCGRPTMAEVGFQINFLVSLPALDMTPPIIQNENCPLTSGSSSQELFPASHSGSVALPMVGSQETIIAAPSVCSMETTSMASLMSGSQSLANLHSRSIDLSLPPCTQAQGFGGRLARAGMTPPAVQIGLPLFGGMATSEHGDDDGLTTPRTPRTTNSMGLLSPHTAVSEVGSMCSLRVPPRSPMASGIGEDDGTPSGLGARQCASPFGPPLPLSVMMSSSVLNPPVPSVCIDESSTPESNAAAAVAATAAAAAAAAAAASLIAATTCLQTSVSGCSGEGCSSSEGTPSHAGHAASGQPISGSHDAESDCHSISSGASGSPPCVTECSLGSSAQEIAAEIAAAPPAQTPEAIQVQLQQQIQLMQDPTVCPESQLPIMALTAQAAQQLHLAQLLNTLEALQRQNQGLHAQVAEERDARIANEEILRQIGSKPDTPPPEHHDGMADGQSREDLHTIPPITIAKPTSVVEEVRAESPIELKHY